VTVFTRHGTTGARTNPASPNQRKGKHAGNRALINPKIREEVVTPALPPLIELYTGIVHPSRIRQGQQGT